jgi:GNAT superfamily N-acetyltransferase
VSETKGSQSADRATAKCVDEAFVIMTALSSDLEELVEIDVALTLRERQNEILRTSVAADGCLVVRGAEKLVGFVTWDLGFFNRPFVRLLVVIESHRRCGLGSKLLLAVERAAAAYGELFVSTETINAPMQALLAVHGYASSGSIDNINAPGNAELVFFKRLAEPGT